MAFVACDNDNEPSVGSSITSDGKISGRLQIIEWDDDYERTTVKAVNSEVDSIAAFSYNRNTDRSVFLVGGKVSNGNFSLQLPEPPAACFYIFADGLRLVDDDTEAEGEIKVSDKEVRCADAYLYAYKNGKVVGDVLRASTKEKLDAEANLVYAEKKLNVTGKYTCYNDSDDKYFIELDIYLNKGWNTIVEKCIYKGNTETEKHTSNNDGNMIWAVDYYYGSYSAPVAEKRFLKAKKNN